MLKALCGKADITIDDVEVEVLEQATHPTRLVKQIEAVEEERRVRRKELRLHFKEDHECTTYEC